MSMICKNQYSHKACHRAQIKSTPNQIAINIMKQSHVWTCFYSKHNVINNTHKNKNTTLKSWNLKWERENPYLFLKYLKRKWCRNGGFSKIDTVSFREWNVEDNEQSQKYERKTEKFWKLTLKRKIRVFRDWNKSPVSHQGKPRNTLKPKVLKNFLSVFHDWKVYPRGSRELSHENLCDPSRLDLPPTNKSPRQTCEHATGLTRDRVAKTGQNCFWNFWYFL